MHSPAVALSCAHIELRYGNAHLVQQCENPKYSSTCTSSFEDNSPLGVIGMVSLDSAHCHRCGMLCRGHSLPCRLPSDLWQVWVQHGALPNSDACVHQCCTELGLPHLFAGARRPVAPSFPFFFPLCILLRLTGFEKLETFAGAVCHLRLWPCSAH